MKSERLFECLLLLMKKKRVSASEMAVELGCSKRSIMRYVESLENAGVPLVSFSGNGGGYEILDTFRLSSTYFTADEYVRLVTAVEQAAMPDLYKNSLIRKLSAMSSESKNQAVADVVIDDSAASAAQKHLLELTGKAIAERRCIEIDYYTRRGDETKRIVEPHCKLYRDGAWYLYAYCRSRKDFRTFKVSRINRLRFTEQCFTRRPYTLETRYALDFADKTADFVRITLLVSAVARFEAEEWAGADAVTPYGDRYLLSCLQPDDKRLRRELLGFGKEIYILSPTSIREEIYRLADQIVQAAKDLSQ